MHNFYTHAFNIERYLETPTQESLDSIINLFDEKGIKKYFWYTLTQDNDNLDLEQWFKILYANDMFILNNSMETENIQEKKYISYWRPLEFLEQISLKFPAEANEKLLLEIINKLIEEYYGLAKKGYILHGHIYWITFKILSNMNSKYLNVSHIDFIKHVLEFDDKTLISADLGKKFFDKIFETENEELIKKFFNLILSFQVEGKELDSLVEDYWLKEFIKEKTSKIPSKYKLSVLDIALSKMNEILNFNNGAYTTIWFPSIEESSQKRYGASTISKVCIDLVRDLLEDLEPNSIYSLIKGMINNTEHSILQRLAIHTINCHYSNSALNELFWNINYNPIDNTNLNHELYKLFKIHKDDFKEQESTQIIKWNKEQDFEGLKKRSQYDIYGNNWINSNKRRILYALKDSTKNTIFNDMFNKYNDLLDYEDDHPEFSSYYMSEATFSESKSPYSSQEILNMTLSDLNNNITTFKPKEDSFRDDVTISGFAMELESTIKENYSKFINELNIFININQTYHYFIIRALSSNISSYQTRELEKCIDFIQQLVNDLDGTPNNNQIMSSFNDFIRNISSSELNIQLTDELVSKIINIFLSLNSKINFYKPEDEYQSDILNSNEGQYYSSIITFSLKVARDKKDELSPSNRWNEELKHIITNDLKEQKSFQLFEVIGQYLPNIYYLDKNWILEEVNNLFKGCDDIYSKSMYIGYFNNNTVYLEIYKDIKNTGAIEKALDYNFSDDRTNNKVIEFICIAFTSDYEKELIDKIITNGTYQQKQTLIKFFENRSGSKNIDIDKHIKPLWEKLLTSLDEAVFKTLYSDLIQWINTLESIDEEIFSLILNTIEKLDSFPMHGSAIDKLYKLTDTNTEEVSDIFIAILQKSNFATYPNEKLIEGIEKIYLQGTKNKANEICNLIGEYGNYSLKELYIRYNP